MSEDNAITIDEARCAVGAAMPGAVDGILQRRWLGSEGELVSCLRQTPQSYDGELAAIRLVKMGEPPLRDWSKLNRAMRRTLMTCHRPGVLKIGYRLDVQANGGVAIRFGVRSTQEGGGIDASTSLANLTDVLSAELPGTVFKREGADNAVMRRFYAPVTGIPGDERSVGDFVAQLVSGMAGRNFSFMVEADAMSSEEIDQALYSCREMLSQIELLKSISVTKGESWTEQVATQVSRSLNETDSESTSSSSKSVLSTAATVAGAIAATVLSGGNAAIGGLVMMGGGSIAPQNTKGKSHSVTKGFSEAFTQSLAVGSSASTTVNVVNAHAEASSEKLRKFASRLEEARLYGAWNVSVCVMADTPRDLDRVKMIVKALQTGENSANEPVRTPMIPFLDEKKTVEQTRIKLANWSIPEWRIVRKGESGIEQTLHPMGKAFSGLATPLSTKELVNWFGMPRENMYGVEVVPAISGFSFANVRANDTSMIRLGDSRMGSVSIPYSIGVDSLVRHALLAGSTRSGKSTTAIRIIDEIRRIRGRDFPFLIIEPVKTEYLELALKRKQEGDRINVFMPGRSKWKDCKLDKLRLNPFEVVRAHGVKHIDVPLHIKYLTATINAALPMQESLPILMEEAIYACYAEKVYPASSDGSSKLLAQWIPEAGQSQEPSEGTPFPTFKDLEKKAPEIVSRLKYHTDANNGFIAALRARIRQFTRHGMPLTEVFVPDGAGQPVEGFWENLFLRPTVINLSAIPSEEDRAFFMAIILSDLYEWRRQEAETIGYSNSLRHLLVIEEAHAVMRKSEDRGMTSMNAAAKSAKMFAEILAEIGAYGQGVLIADQSPSVLIPDAVRNTNTKIVHKLQTEDDIRQMGKAVNLTEEQQRAIVSLAQGEAIVRTGDDDKPSRIIVTRSCE